MLGSAFPWGNKVARVRLTTPGRTAEASLVCGSGATYASVYVACSCTECAQKPLRAVRNGGNILSLDAWARHARTSTDDILVYEGDDGKEDSLPLLAWLQRAGERLGGASLKRRQVNIFWWSGSVTAADAAKALAAEAEVLQARAGKVAGLATGLAATGQPSTAWPGYGTWRAATIRGFDARTGRFEVKYHDEPKRSTAHILLPFAVLHFARNPPADGDSVRCNPEQPPQATTAVAANAAAASSAGGTATHGGQVDSDAMQEDGNEVDGAVEAPHSMESKAPKVNVACEDIPPTEGSCGGGRALKRRAQQQPTAAAPHLPASLVFGSSAAAASTPAAGPASTLAFASASAAARLRCRSSSTCLPALESATASGAATDLASGQCEPPAAGAPPAEGLLPPHPHLHPHRPSLSQSPSPLPPPSPSCGMQLPGPLTCGAAAAATAAALNAAACPYIQEDATDALMVFGFEDDAGAQQQRQQDQQHQHQHQLLQSRVMSGGSVSSLCSLTAAGLRGLRVSSVCRGGSSSPGAAFVAAAGAGGQQTPPQARQQARAVALPLLPQLPLLSSSQQQQLQQHQQPHMCGGPTATAAATAATGSTSCHSSSSGYLASSSALYSGGGGGTGAAATGAGQTLGPLLSFCAAASRAAAAPLPATADASSGRPVSAPGAVPMFPANVMAAAASPAGATPAPAPIAAAALPAAAAVQLTAPGGSIAAAAYGGGEGGRSTWERLSLTRIVPPSASSGGASFTAVAAALPTPHAGGAPVSGEWHHDQPPPPPPQQQQLLLHQQQQQQQQHQMQVAARMQAQVASLLQPSIKAEPPLGAAATAATAAAGPFTRTSQPPSPALPGFAAGHLQPGATAATAASVGSGAIDATSLAAAVVASAGGSGDAATAAGSASGMITAASSWGFMGGSAPAAGASSSYSSLVSACRPSPLLTPGGSPPHPAATAQQHAAAAAGASGSWAGPKTELPLLPSFGTAAAFQRPSQPLQLQAHPATSMLQLQPSAQTSQQAVADAAQQHHMQVQMQMCVQAQPPLQPLLQSHFCQEAAAAVEGCSSVDSTCYSLQHQQPGLRMPTVPVREELATAAGTFAAGPAGVAGPTGYSLCGAWRQTSEAAALASLMEEWSQQPLIEADEAEAGGAGGGADGEPACGDRHRLTQVLLSHGFGGGPADMLLM